MKKLIFLASALAGLFFAASCQQENLEPVQQGNTVTYTVQVPENIATKAGGDGFTLHYEVYRQDDLNTSNGPVYEGTKTFVVGTADVDLNFVKDQEYTVLFWAQQTNGAQAYNIEDLRNVKLQTLTANDLTAEVFAGNDFVRNCKSEKGGTVVLVRPVAQLNIATTLAGLTIGTSTSKSTVVPTQSKVVVDGLYGTYNVANGHVATKLERTYTATDVPGTEFKSTYKLMATNYLGFIPQGGDNVEVTFTIFTESDGEIDHTVSNVPVKANYQTNILGNLISATADYQVTLEDWTDAGKDMEVLTDGLVKNINGDYEISSAAGLAYAINNLFVDANGVANPSVFYIDPGTYNLEGHKINSVVVTSGTLKVYDTKPVVTRSTLAINGVIITGLEGALIETVKEDATVFFSGITIQDFKGQDDEAALVKTNEGKVVLVGCDIIDEDGNPDEETELVGGDVPAVEIEKVDEPTDGMIYTAAQLAEAFADETVEAIALGADIALESTLVFPEGRTATLDLRGWKLMTAENMPLGNPLVAVNGVLTITDSYGIGGISASKTSAIQANHGGKLTINCNVTAHEATVRAIGGEAIISGGKYVQTGTYYSDPSTLRYTIDSRPDEEGNVGKIKIDGGEFISNNGVINAGGEITITGGTFNNDISEVAATRHMMYVNGSAVVNITGGEFFGKANSSAGGEHICVYTSNANVNISGGKFTSLKGDGSANSIISEYSVGSAISVTGGTFNTNNGLNKYIHEDYMTVSNTDGTLTVIKGMAKVNNKAYDTFQAAINAVQDGQTVTLLDMCNEDVTFTQTADKSFVLDGNNQIMTGTIKIIARAGTDGPVTLVIKNFNFTTTDKERDFISSVETNYYPRNLTVSNCTFEGPEAACDVTPVSIKSGSVIVMEKCTANNVHSLFQNAGGGWNYTIKECTVTNSGRGINLHSVQGALVEDVKIVASNEKYGIRVDAAYAETTTIRNCEITAFCPIVARKASADYKFVFEGNNKMKALNTDGIWCAIGTSEYEANGKLPTSATGKVTVDLKDNSLNAKGIYGAYWPPVAKVGNTEYGSIDEAIAAWTNNTTLTLLANVTLSDVVTLKSTEYHILDLGTYTMTAAKGKDAISISNEGRSSASYALDIKADATNPGGITATGKAVVKTNGKSGVKDRPIIRFYNGVFTGTNVVYHSGSNGTNCPQFWFYGGVFNGTVYANRALFQFHGGTFNGNLHISVDSSAYALISGGRFINLNNSYRSDLDKDNNIKITIGSAKGVYDRGIYVDDQGYFVVGGSSITDFGEQFQAKVNIKPSSKYDYLYYSSAAEHGLYYTNADVAIAKHGEANVVLK